MFESYIEINHDLRKSKVKENRDTSTKDMYIFPHGDDPASSVLQNHYRRTFCAMNGYTWPAHHIRVRRSFLTGFEDSNSQNPVLLAKLYIYNQNISWEAALSKCSIFLLYCKVLSSYYPQRALPPHCSRTKVTVWSVDQALQLTDKAPTANTVALDVPKGVKQQPSTRPLHPITFIYTIKQ